MRFDFLELHDPLEDNTLLTWLRAYTIIPKHVESPSEKNQKALEIIRVLREIDSRLASKGHPSWRTEWIKLMPCKVSKSALKDWFMGRASVPLIAIKILNHFGNKQEIDLLNNKIEFISSSRGKPFRLPVVLDENLAYLVAAILCDGHLYKDSFRVSFEITNEEIIKKFQAKLNTVFSMNYTYSIRIDKRKNRKKLFKIMFKSKPIVRLLTRLFNIPRGKKSHLIEVPEQVLCGSPEIKKAFLEGVFDTDGGHRGRGLGLSTASPVFRNQIAIMLEELNLKVSRDEWVNRKYNKKYYGLYFRKKASETLSCARVPKRPKGPDHIFYNL